MNLPGVPATFVDLSIIFCVYDNKPLFGVSTLSIRSCQYKSSSQTCGPGSCPELSPFTNTPSLVVHVPSKLPNSVNRGVILWNDTLGSQEKICPSSSSLFSEFKLWSSS